MWRRRVSSGHMCCDGSGVEGRGSEEGGAWLPARLSQSGEVGEIGRAQLSPAARSAAVRDSSSVLLIILSLSDFPVGGYPLSTLPCAGLLS